MRKGLLVVAVLLLSIFAIAQVPQNLPLDPKIRTGVLENGLTYFIVKNQEPVGQAEFYIMQKVGSILEEENQRGLAHFLEHMAFNGTENFPGNGVISYLETIGVKFGQNLNAGTGADLTIYNISAVPVKREGIIDSCLLILRDWSCAISLESEAIDKERGVIREEYRQFRNAENRMKEAALLDIMPGSKYPHRWPIGTLEVIDNFSHNEIRDYYHKWYRPDLQGIMVVGDIDPDAVEIKIKTLFGAIPKHENPAPREEFPIPDNTEPLVSVNSDPEFPYNVTMLMYKQEPLPKEVRGTAAFLVFDYMQTIMSSMINTRLAEIVQKPDAPFVQAGVSYSGFILTNRKSILGFTSIAKEGQIENSLRAVVNEVQKVKQFGFTAAEYERAKASYISSLEQQYNERDKQKNSYYADMISNHFLQGDPMPSIETVYTMISQIASVLSVEQFNQMAKPLITENNVTILSLLPQKEGVVNPTSEKMLEVYNMALKDEVMAYEETVSDEPLIPSEPTPGSIVSQTAQSVGEATEWKLSNGATVVIKKTDFKADQILMGAYSHGGYSLFGKSDILATKVINDIIPIGGLGNFSAVDMRKVMAGKNASVSANVSAASEGMSGTCAPKDIETLMQLIYLNFTSLRNDPEAFQSYIGRMEAQLRNAEAQPTTAFSDTLNNILYSGSEYAKRMSLDALGKIDYEKVLNLAKERFANAADFTFVFIGNIDEASIKPLVEKYIASLPGDPSKREQSKALDMIPPKGIIKNHFDKQMQTPKATVYSIYSGDIPYTLENNTHASAVKLILDMVLLRSLREDEQGTYSTGSAMQMQRYPKEFFLLLFAFDTDVPLTEKLLNRAYKEFDDIIQNGFMKEDFDKAVEFLAKQYDQNLRENSYWRGVVSNLYMYNMDTHTDYKSILDAMTPEKLHTFFKDAIGQGNSIEVIMRGKE